MIGIRTPVKKDNTANQPRKSPQTVTEEAGPSKQDNVRKNSPISQEPAMPHKAGPNRQTSVRRSIGEWEASRTTSSKPAPVVPAEPTQTNTTKSRPTARRESAETTSNPTTSNTERAKQAKSWVIKAKLNLNNSRNLKTDIKAEVTQAIDMLYKLVKEAEAERMDWKEHNEEAPKKKTEEKVEKSVDASKQETSQLLTKIEEHSRLLLESNTRMEELKAAIEAQKERTENVEVPTYAGVAAVGSSSALKKRTLHSVVVTSSNEEDTGEEVYERVRKAVDAKEGWIKVEKVRKAKNRKVIMGFETKEERERMKERLRVNGAGLAVEEVKNKDPMLILKSVLSNNTDEDVLRAFRNQNPDVFHGLDGETGKVEVKYRKRARNPHTGHVVISATPTIWRRAIERGYVHIDLQRIRVEDQTPLMQCSRCLGFGHSKKYCVESVDLCSHCGGPHLRAECADWMAGVPAACRNCKKANSSHTEHNAFSAECPQRKKWDALARTAVAYC